MPASNTETYQRPAARFSSGAVCMTPGAARLGSIGIDLGALFQRHIAGEWGDLGDDDKAANDRSLLDGSRILSAYDTPHGRLWILTEAENDEGERERTTLLLPEEY